MAEKPLVKFQVVWVDSFNREVGFGTYDTEKCDESEALWKAKKNIFDALCRARLAGIDCDYYDKDRQMYAWRMDNEGYKERYKIYKEVNGVRTWIT
jgi:hypothetical protein